MEPKVTNVAMSGSIMITVFHFPVTIELKWNKAPNNTKMTAKDIIWVWVVSSMASSDFDIFQEYQIHLC